MPELGVERGVGDAEGLRRLRFDAAGKGGGPVARRSVRASREGLGGEGRWARAREMAGRSWCMGRDWTVAA